VWSIAGLVAMLLSYTLSGMSHLSKYLSLSIVVMFLVKLFFVIIRLPDHHPFL